MGRVSKRERVENNLRRGSHSLGGGSIAFVRFPSQATDSGRLQPIADGIAPTKIAILSLSLIVPELRRC